MPRAQPVVDAGDAPYENLGAAGGIAEISNLQNKSGVGPFGPALFNCIIAAQGNARFGSLADI